MQVRDFKGKTVILEHQDEKRNASFWEASVQESYSWRCSSNANLKRKFLIPNNMEKKERVIVYIDGFNLYFGMTSSYADIKWLNVELLAKNLLKSSQELFGVKYFTSMVSNNPPKEQRQRAYFSALETTSVQIIYGHYKSKTKSCRRCGHIWNDNEEKMTDVNIAVEMLKDAMEDKFDMAMLISGDSDLVPPILAIHEKFPQKRVFVAFPPNRSNVSVKNIAKGSMIIGRKKLKDSQFPKQISLQTGYILNKPTEWQ